MLFLTKHFRKQQRQIPVIILHGKIMTSDDSINMESKRQVIDAAFACAKNVVFLSINSPGGLPGQSQMVASYIRMKAEQRDISVIAFIEDFGASGGYWLATAADEIYCLDTSFVGSIGVISGGFGLQGLLQEYKIERRLVTAGESKSRDDMFSEMTEEDKAYKLELLTQMHEVFKAQVLSRRPNINKDVFDARVAIGDKAKDLGLVDGVKNMYLYAKEHYPGYRLMFYAGKRRLGAGIARRLFTSDMADSMPQLRLP